MKSDSSQIETAPGEITLFQCGWLAAWDGQQHQIVAPGELAIQDDRILYAGPRFPGQADHVLTEPTWFVCPGFINLHGHIGVEVMAQFVDLPPDASLAPSREFSERMPLNLEPTLTLEEQRLGGAFSLVQMLRCGATTIVDAGGSGPIWWLGNPPTDEELLVDTIGEVGARAYLSLAFRSARIYQRPDGSRAWHWDEEMGLAGLRQGLAFAERYRGAHGGRVETLLSPHQLHNCSTDLLRATLAEARAAQLPIQIHVAEYEYDLVQIRSRFNDTSIGGLHQIGFLGPDIILGHCRLVSGLPEIGPVDGDPDRDLKLIADAGSSVAHSPLVFARRGQALHSLPRYLDHGITVGLGCDIWPADIIAEMRLAWFMGKQTSGDSSRPSAAEVFHAATVGSADALGRADLGRLAAGAKADLVAIDLGRYHYGPVLDPIRALLISGSGQDVDTIYVDGRRLVAGGQVLTVDDAELQAAARGIMVKQLQAASARDPHHRTAEQLLHGAPMTSTGPV